MSSSVWWPTPTRPSSWFSDDELKISRRYNRPLARAALARVISRLVLLAALHGVLSRLPDEWSTARVVVLAAPLVAAAWWLPAAVVDLWFEYRHEPRFGHQSLPLHRFLAGSMATLVLAAVAVLVVTAAAYWLMGWTDWWWLVAAIGATATVLVMARVDRNIRSLGEDLQPLKPEDEARFGQLATTIGVPDVAFAVTETDAVRGLNAFATKLSGRPHVVVTTDLLLANRDLADHVVAHELAHLGRRHLTTTLGVSAATVGLVVAGLGLLVEVDLPFRWLDLEARDPRNVVVVAVLVLVMAGATAPLLAWIGRAHERQADAVAFAVNGGLPLPLVRALHVSDRADLDPGLLARWVAGHPSPAERLQRASRESSHRVPSET